jgi:hypothetical protein
MVEVCIVFKDTTLKVLKITILHSGLYVVVILPRNKTQACSHNVNCEIYV